MKRVLLALLALYWGLVSCGAKSRVGPLTEFPSYSAVHESSGKMEEQVEIGRLVVAEAAIEIQSLEPDSVHSRVIDMAFEYGGYVLNADEGATSIRIPATNFRDAMREIAKLGKITNEKITGQDVTDSFKDLEVRLNNAEKTRQRYLALLDIAKNIEEILRLEKELERLNKEIELYKGKIERLQHLVEYCTITVKTAQEIKPGPISLIFNGMYSGIKWMFVRN
jgi:hypothetical protein